MNTEAQHVAAAAMRALVDQRAVAGDSAPPSLGDLADAAAKALWAHYGYQPQRAGVVRDLDSEQVYWRVHSGGRMCVAPPLDADQVQALYGLVDYVVQTDGVLGSAYGHSSWLRLRGLLDRACRALGVDVTASPQPPTAG